MKSIVYCLILCFVGLGQFAKAQSKVTEQQKTEYTKGNQDPKFLKAYIEALKADGQEDALNEAVDRYLMVIPLNERYARENLAYFLEYINDLSAKSFTDVIEHWGDIHLTGEQAEKVAGKINEVCKTTFFQSLFREREGIECPDVDCSSLVAALEKSEIPVPRVRRRFVEMWQNWKEKKVDHMIVAFEQLISYPLVIQVDEKAGNDFQVDLMMDGVVLGNVMNYILEKCNFDQCSKMFKIMDQAIEKNGRDGFWDMIGKSRDNFEGKKMMMEMGEE
jgi:hypothetical protein